MKTALAAAAIAICAMTVADLGAQPYSNRVIREGGTKGE
jgi:hypothetical protein